MLKSVLTWTINFMVTLYIGDYKKFLLLVRWGTTGKL